MTRQNLIDFVILFQMAPQHQRVIVLPVLSYSDSVLKWYIFKIWIIFYCHLIPLSFILGGCAPADYQFYENTFAIGGAYQPEYMTKQACLDACAANQGCFGVDMDSNGNQFCWFHPSASGMTNRQTRNGVEHAEIKERCPQASKYWLNTMLFLQTWSYAKPKQNTCTTLCYI